MIKRMPLLKFSVAILKVLGPLVSYLQPVFYTKKKKQCSRKRNLRIKAWISYTVKNFHKQPGTEIKHLKPQLKKKKNKTPLKHMFYFREVSLEIFLLNYGYSCWLLYNSVDDWKRINNTWREKVLLIRSGIHLQPLTQRLQTNTLSANKILNIMYGKEWQQT